MEHQSRPHSKKKYNRTQAETCAILVLLFYKSLNRHNREAQYLHWKICKHYEAQHAERWCKHQSEAVTETDNVAILWDYRIQTEIKIKAIKSDITVKGKREKNCELIDFKIAADKNVSVAEFEKSFKYKDLKIEEEKIWNMKTVTIPVLIGALGLIKKGTEEHLEQIWGSPNLAEMTKNSTYRHCSYLTKNLINVKKSNNEQLKQCLSICSEQKLINYTPCLYLHFLFTLFILFILYCIYDYL